jgi:DNA-3-methyladenine glycosylase
MRIKRDFFLQPTLKVAKDLLGQYVVRSYKGNLIIGKIVETEAYIGPKDKASHAYCAKEQPTGQKKKVLFRNWSKIKNHIQDKENFLKRILKLKHAKVTKRNLAEYLKGGHIYIYLVYGIYYQFNITTYKEGYPECVLIRSLEPISNLKKLNLNISNGPGKLCRFLKLDNSFWAEDLCQSKRIWISNGKKISSSEIVKSKRIGIEYAQEHSELLWRFYIKGNEWVSKV